MILSPRLKVVLLILVGVVMVGDLGALARAGGRHQSDQAPLAHSETTLWRPAGDSGSTSSTAMTTAPLPALRPGSSTATKKQDGASSTTAPALPSVKRGEGDLVFELVVTPACVVRGETLTITIRTVSDSRVAVTGYDAASRQIGEPYAGPVGSDGTLTLNTNVKATAMPGMARVFAVGSAPDRHASRYVSFEIAELAC